jgi:hypothetical protein
VLRDFKKYTSKQVLAAISGNQKESRKEWMLGLFSEEGDKNSRNSEYHFWRQGLSRTRCGNNQPIEVYSGHFTFQKMNYIHQNPVEAGVVEKAEHYLYSSAKDYFLQKKCGLLEIDFI